MNKWVSDVEKFMTACGQTTDRMNPRQAALYTGLQCEELAEKLRRLGIPSVNVLDAIGGLLKIGKYDNHFSAAREGLADDDFDIAWVSIAAMLSEGIHPETAWLCGAPTNLSKIVGGKVIRDENGKIQKPANWQPPDFRAALMPSKEMK